MEKSGVSSSRFSVVVLLEDRNGMVLDDDIALIGHAMIVSRRKIVNGVYLQICSDRRKIFAYLPCSVGVRQASNPCLRTRC